MDFHGSLCRSVNLARVYALRQGKQFRWQFRSMSNVETDRNSLEVRATSPENCGTVLIIPCSCSSFQLAATAFAVLQFVPWAGMSHP